MDVDHTEKLLADEESFLSQFCSKKFKHWASLYQHIDTHRNQSFECDKCSKAFVSRQYSTLHIRNVHTEPMDLQCAIVAMHIACYVKKKFKQLQARLKRHKPVQEEKVRNLPRINTKCRDMTTNS